LLRGPLSRHTLQTSYRSRGAHWCGSRIRVRTTAPADDPPAHMGISEHSSTASRAIHTPVACRLGLQSVLGQPYRSRTDDCRTENRLESREYPRPANRAVYASFTRAHGTNGGELFSAFRCRAPQSNLLARRGLVVPQAGSATKRFLFRDTESR